MKKFGTIILAVLLMMVMAIPVFADEATTTEAPMFTYADGHISGSYDSEGLINIYVDDELAGGSKLNVEVTDGEHTVKVYENGVLVHTETVTAETPEPVPPTPENPDQPEEPGEQEEPTPGEQVEPTPGEQVEPTPGEQVEPTPGEQENPAPSDKTDDKSSTNTSQTTTKTDTTKKATNVPKTGDAENMGAFMVLGLAAALTLVAAKRIKSR